MILTKKQLEALWQYSQKIGEEDEQNPTPPDFARISKKKVEQTIEKIDSVLRDKEM